MKQAVVLGLAMLALGACERKADNDDGAAIALAQPIDYSPEEKATLLAAMPAPFNAADLADGEKQFAKCRSCHTITAEKMNLTGPHLYGVFGRKAGSEPGYPFTDAMKNHGVVWDFVTLDAYLEAPQVVVKGTKMALAGGGIDDANKRRNLIAYLKIETTPRPEPAPAASENRSASE
ncbi:c-type cytochrome [Asticcacaulis biprosthecium]|nr:cytochrome c family protein [Asticcacaulis biprosthecium]